MPKDLSPVLTLVVDPAMTAEQQYDALLDEHTPDYTAVPLTIWPEVSVTYPDAGPTDTLPTVEEEVEHLQAVQWYYIDTDGTEKKLPVESSDYNDNVAGCPHKYALQVKKNIPTSAPLVLLMRAVYVNEGVGKPVSATLTVSSVTVSEPMPKILLGIPPVLIYNPLTDKDTYAFSAEMIQGGKTLVAGTDYKLCWEMYDEENAAWIVADPEEIETAEMRTLTDNNTKAELNLMMMANNTRYRVRGAFKRTDGSWFGDIHAEPTAVPASDAKAPEAYFTIFRDCGKLDLRKVVFPNTYSGNADKLHYRVDISCGGKIVENPEDEMDISWYCGPADKDGNAQITPANLVGTGREVYIPVSKIKTGYAVTPDAVLKDRYGVVVYNTDTVLIDNSANWLITR